MTNNPAVSNGVGIVTLPAGASGNIEILVNEQSGIPSVILSFKEIESGILQITMNPGTPLAAVGDFNADGKVDIADVSIMVEHWHTDYSLCDIGPMPWGDGKVDIEDLKVFMAEWEKENPAAQP